LEELPVRNYCKAVTRPKPEKSKRKAGRKPYDAVLMFKIPVLQTFVNIADKQLEYLIRKLASRSCVSTEARARVPGAGRHLPIHGA
jgi:hypothetical protein